MLVDAESHSLWWFTRLSAGKLQRICGAIAKISDIGHAETPQIFSKRTSMLDSGRVRHEFTGPV
jgi:hypothetical protein